MPIKSRRPVYVSYANADEHAVKTFLDPLGEAIRQRNLPIELWQDRTQLQPGTSWRMALFDVLKNAIGMLVFVSDTSMGSKWLRDELHVALASKDRLIVPVILEHADELPLYLKVRKWVDISHDLGNHSLLREKANRLADELSDALPLFEDKAPLSDGQAERLAEITASEARKVTAPPPHDEQVATPSTVFVVHGHDIGTRDLVCNALSDIGVESVVLSQKLGQSQSLLQKFLSVSKKARFAVVLLTADDYGASLRQYDTPRVAERALQFRARQNVVLELGFFYGHLGWENVFVLQQKPPKVFPNFERPSDLDGVVFDAIDEDGTWKMTLANKLQEAGFLLRHI